MSGILATSVESVADQITTKSITLGDWGVRFAKCGYANKIDKARTDRIIALLDEAQQLIGAAYGVAEQFASENSDDFSAETELIPIDWEEIPF
jgi:hypothetical protein